MVKSSSFMTPIGNESVAQKVINKITDAIITGELKPGDKLPTEIELVSAFGVGRNSVREAIRILVAYGVVEIRRPEGTFVCSGFSEKMINPTLYSIILQKDESHKDIVGLRQLVERGVLENAVDEELSQEELAQIEDALDVLKEKIKSMPPDMEAIAEADMGFHKALAKATHNSLIVRIHDVVAELSWESRHRSIRAIFDDNNKQYLIDTHQEQYDIVRGKCKKSLEEVIKYSYLYWKNTVT